jgi:hypothetical protein
LGITSPLRGEARIHLDITSPLRGEARINQVVFICAREGTVIPVKLETIDA